MTKVKFINISDIVVNEDTPTDEKFIAIFERILSKELPCYSALIKIEGIKPFTDYKPTLSTAHTHKMLSMIQSGQYLRIHVYQEGEFFIMSDDYNIYYTYLEMGVSEFPCFVLGSEPIGEYVVDKKKIEYPPMTFEELPEPTRN